MGGVFLGAWSIVVLSGQGSWVELPCMEACTGTHGDISHASGILHAGAAAATSVRRHEGTPPHNHILRGFRWQLWQLRCVCCNCCIAALKFSVAELHARVRCRVGGGAWCCHCCGSSSPLAMSAGCPVLRKTAQVVTSGDGVIGGGGAIRALRVYTISCN